MTPLVLIRFKTPNVKGSQTNRGGRAVGDPFKTLLNRTSWSECSSLSLLCISSRVLWWERGRRQQTHASSTPITAWKYTPPAPPPGRSLITGRIHVLEGSASDPIRGNVPKVACGMKSKQTASLGDDQLGSEDTVQQQEQNVAQNLMPYLCQSLCWGESSKRTW